MPGKLSLPCAYFLHQPGQFDSLPRCRVALVHPCSKGIGRHGIRFGQNGTLGCHSHHTHTHTHRPGVPSGPTSQTHHSRRWGRTWWNSTVDSYLVKPSSQKRGGMQNNNNSKHHRKPGTSPLATANLDQDQTGWWKLFQRRQTLLEKVVFCRKSRWVLLRGRKLQHRTRFSHLDFTMKAAVGLGIESSGECETMVVVLPRGKKGSNRVVGRTSFLHKHYECFARFMMCARWVRTFAVFVLEASFC